MKNCTIKSTLSCHSCRCMKSNIRDNVQISSLMLTYVFDDIRKFRFIIALLTKSNFSYPSELFPVTTYEVAS